MLDLSGTRKKEACEELANFELLIGPQGVTELMVCGDDFPAEFRQAKVFCGTDNDRKQLCKIATSQARLYVCTCARRYSAGKNMSVRENGSS